MSFHVVILHHAGETDISTIQAETPEEAKSIALLEYRKERNLKLDVPIYSRVPYSNSDPMRATGYFNGLQLELEKAKGRSNESQANNHI